MLLNFSPTDALGAHFIFSGFICSQQELKDSFGLDPSIQRAVSKREGGKVDEHLTAAMPKAHAAQMCQASTRVSCTQHPLKTSKGKCAPKDL